MFWFQKTRDKEIEYCRGSDPCGFDTYEYITIKVATYDYYTREKTGYVLNT